jgi:O-antigen/teichoic acid export membrane protein
MSSASLWGIVIQFIFFPILSRIYTPESYGVFTVFNTFVALLGATASLSYQKALVLPKTDVEFAALLRVALRTTVVVCIIAQVVFFAFGGLITETMDIQIVGSWIYLVPFFAFLLALDQIVQSWTVRSHAFRAASIVGVPVTLFPKLFNVGYGKYVNNGAEGLILTGALLYLLRIVLFPFFIVKDFFSTWKIKVTKEQRVQAKSEYRDYPRYVFWGNLLNIGSGYIVPLTLPLFFVDASEIGLFSYAMVLIDLPIRILGSGIAPVFLKRGVEMYATDPQAFAQKTWHLYKVLSLIFLPFLLILVFFGEPLYSIAFGEQWAQSGIVAGILIGGFIFRYVSNPISSVFNITRNEKRLMTFQIVLFLLRMAGILIPGAAGMGFMNMMFGFAIANALSYLLYIVWIFRILNVSTSRVVLFTALTLIIPAAGGWIYLILF